MYLYSKEVGIKFIRIAHGGVDGNIKNGLEWRRHAYMAVTLNGTIFTQLCFLPQKCAAVNAVFLGHCFAALPFFDVENLIVAQSKPLTSRRVL